MGGHATHGGGYETHAIHGGGYETHATHGGGYETHATNGGGYETHGGGYTSMKIEVDRSVVNKGEMIDVKCSGDLQEGAYVWVEKDGETLAGGTVGYYPHTSVLVMPEQSGSIRCSVQTPSNGVLYSPELFIEVLKSFSVTLQKEQLQDTHLQAMNCLVSGADVDLDQVSVVIQHYDFDGNILIKNETLPYIFDPLNHADAGLYRCEASTHFPFFLKATSNDIAIHVEGTL